MHLMGITPTGAINQVGAWQVGNETDGEPTVAGWADLKEITRNDTFAAGLTNTG